MFNTQMKRKTRNAEYRRPIIEWANVDGRVREDPPRYAGLRKEDSTPNAQRPTSNAQRKTSTRFDLEERLLEFSARIIRLVDDLDAVLESIAASGWKAAGKPQTLEAGPNAGKRVVYVRDPDGTTIEFMQRQKQLIVESQ